MTRFVDIQCSNCGRIDRVSYRMDCITHTIKKGWNSFGNALYCPNCSKTWNERNKDKSLAGNWNTIRIIDEWYDRQNKITRKDEGK